MKILNEFPTSFKIFLNGIYETISGTRSLKYIVTPEGMAVKDGANWDFEYNLKDHLGNVRAVIHDNGSGVAALIQQKHYYPFGMEISDIPSGIGDNLYLYNGKEHQNDFGLDCYDYGARFYDLELGRFHSVDPLTDSTFNFTPYHYAINNPIIFIDPDGNRHIPVNQVLNHYGYISTEKQLFPTPSLYQRTVKALNIAKNILDPSAPIGLSIMVEVFTNYTDARDVLNRNPEKADWKYLVSYHENLKEVDRIISGKIEEVNKSIDALRAEESESGNLG